MRTSFHHQSEAQPSNGPLTAATSPDTPSPSPTTQSDVRGDFLNKRQMPAIGGLPAMAKVSGSGRQSLSGDFGTFVSGLKIPFPGNRDHAKQRLVQMRRKGRRF